MLGLSAAVDAGYTNACRPLLPAHGQGQAGRARPARRAGTRHARARENTAARLEAHP